MNRATLERMERSYRIRRWIAGGVFIVAGYLLLGCFLKSLYFIFQSSPISGSEFLKQVFYQIYLWAFIKPLGLEAGERFWGIFPVIESRDIFAKENVFRTPRITRGFQ